MPEPPNQKYHPLKTSIADVGLKTVKLGVGRARIQDAHEYVAKIVTQWVQTV